jgi:hypothetical protein
MSETARTYAKLELELLDLENQVATEYDLLSFADIKSKVEELSDLVHHSSLESPALRQYNNVKFSIGVLYVILNPDKPHVIEYQRLQNEIADKSIKLKKQLSSGKMVWDDMMKKWIEKYES